MTDSDTSPRPLTIGDLDWVVDLAARRARELEPFAPRFWRRAQGARAAHATFLGRLIQDPQIPSTRTAKGYAFGLPQPGQVLIDDLAVEDETDWATHGRQLIRSVGATSPVRLVCPAPERARTALAAEMGLRVAETWWHRDLEEAADAAEKGLEVPGGRGRLVTAPPVYDPGGPVLLATSVRDAAALHTLEQHAAAAGARVAVVSQRPDDRGLGLLLAASGYQRTCEFRTGTLGR